MNKAQGAAATGESDEITSQQSEEQPQETAQVSTEAAEKPTDDRAQAGQTLLGAVLADMDLPPEVLESVRGEEAPPTEPEESEKAGEEEQTEEEQQQEPAPAQAPAAPAAEKEEPVPENWPNTAKARVKEEADKRRTRTKERDKAIGEREHWQRVAQELHQQLQQNAGRAAGPAPTQQDPLANVLNPQELARAEAQYEEILEFAETHPEGAEQVLAGKDANGNEIRKDYTPEEIIQMKLTAEKVLRKAVPAKREYLGQAAAWTQQAFQDHPELFERGSNMNQEAELMLEQLPEVRRFPDFLMWIGDAIRGRNARLEQTEAKKNGQRKGAEGKPLSPAAQAILNQPKLRPAPGVVKRGSSPESERGTRGKSDVDQKEAKEEFAKRGYSDEALEDFVGASMDAQRGRRGGKEPTLA